MPYFEKYQHIFYKILYLNNVVENKQNINLKVESVVLIQYTFCQIQRLSPYGLLAARSVCALEKKKKNPVFIHSPGSVNQKQTRWLGFTQHYSVHAYNRGKAIDI